MAVCLNTKSAYIDFDMLVHDKLSYYDGELRIPNKELMLEFENALEDDDFGPEEI